MTNSSVTANASTIGQPDSDGMCSTSSSRPSRTVDALVSFDCRVVKTLTHGTHTIFLGQVEQILVGQKGKPLLYSDGQYAKLASLTLGEPLPEGLDYWGF